MHVENVLLGKLLPGKVLAQNVSVRNLLVGLVPARWGRACLVSAGGGKLIVGRGLVVKVIVGTGLGGQVRLGKVLVET